MTGHDLSDPRLAGEGPATLAGPAGRYDMASRATIPDQWRRFARQGGSRLDGVLWGACYAMSDDGFSYLSGVADGGPLEEGWRRASLGPTEWAVFAHCGGIAALPTTMQAIFGHWLPASGRSVAAAIDGTEGFLERYGETFDPRTGSGEIEVWLPLVPR